MDQHSMAWFRLPGGKIYQFSSLGLYSPTYSKSLTTPPLRVDDDESVCLRHRGLVSTTIRSFAYDVE
jgi:hypothetical protein